MEIFEKVIEVPIVFVCSDSFKWSGKGVRFGSLENFNFPKNCGDEFKQVQVAKDQPVTVEVTKSVEQNFNCFWGGDSSVKPLEFTFKEGVSYDLQILDGEDGLKKIEIKPNDSGIIHQHGEIG